MRVKEHPIISDFKKGRLVTFEYAPYTLELFWKPKPDFLVIDLA